MRLFKLGAIQYRHTVQAIQYPSTAVPRTCIYMLGIKKGLGWANARLSGNTLEVGYTDNFKMRDECTYCTRVRAYNAYVL